MVSDVAIGVDWRVAETLSDPEAARDAMATMDALVGAAPEVDVFESAVARGDLPPPGRVWVNRFIRGALSDRAEEVAAAWSGELSGLDAQQRATAVENAVSRLVATLIEAESAGAPLPIWLALHDSVTVTLTLHLLAQIEWQLDGTDLLEGRVDESWGPPLRSGVTNVADGTRRSMASRDPALGALLAASDFDRLGPAPTPSRALRFAADLVSQQVGWCRDS
jgi:hypothetical protein